jgi:hypothetical protein
MNSAMTSRRERVLGLCQTALKRIDEALVGNAPTTLSHADLTHIKQEVTHMASTLDPRVYKPSYGRFITDAYEGGDELTDFLLDVSYQYSQRLK